MGVDYLKTAFGVAVAMAIKRPKSKWCKKWLLDKYRYSYKNLLKELASNKPNNYKYYLRIQTRYILQ